MFEGSHRMATSAPANQQTLSVRQDADITPLVREARKSLRLDDTLPTAVC